MPLGRPRSASARLTPERTATPVVVYTVTKPDGEPPTVTMPDVEEPP